MSNIPLRQAHNSVAIRGKLRSMTLQIKTNDRGEQYISGDLVIVTSKDSEHRVTAFSKEYTSAQPPVPSKVFRGLKRVMETFVSVASQLEKGVPEEEAWASATIVGVRGGQLELNEYYAQSGDLLSEIRIRSNFFSALAEPYEPCATFEIEGYMSGMKPEMRAMEPTGRLEIELIVPTFGGRVSPMKFIATPEAGAYIRDHYEKGRTTELYGEIVNTVRREVTTKSGFAGQVQHATESHIREFLVNNGRPDQLSPDSDKAYRTEDIQAAMRARETEYLPQLLARSQSGEPRRAVPGSAFSMNRPSTPTPVRAPVTTARNNW